MSKAPSEKNRALARLVHEAFKSRKTEVFSYSDEEGNAAVDVLHAADTPEIGSTSYSTLGLSDSPNEIPSAGDIRVELVTSAGSEFDHAGSSLSTASTYLIRGKRPFYPGAMIPGAVVANDGDSPLPHLLLTSPFFWPQLGEVTVEGERVAFLLAVPISDSEFRFGIEKGGAELQGLLDSKRVDVLDWNRKPVV